MIDQIPLAGVIGSPIAHSRSPVLFNHWLRVHGIRGHYVPLHINQADLRDTLPMLPKMGFVGINVTIPHKETVLTMADVITDRAALIGAANTLTFRQGKIYADNTDGYGFIANLRQAAPDWDAKQGPAAILGAGGASRAVIHSLIELGVVDIRLSNRSRTRAEALRKEFGPKITVYEWVQAGNMLEGAATVVNTTSLGMAGKPEFRVPLDGLEPGCVVSDLVYTPLHTVLLQEAGAMGCRVVDGLGMLLHQATPGFERWFGAEPTVDQATRKVVLG
ncbi:shikimate dehydrogenase [Actibacterium sp. 188UL27-1]|uniref:shikimate dehydrogenase n=1 Tax=Actibacterium sp. 188UL27-1 TaxID=2786961 RepID=UPI0019590EB5|nr:shikimate dehydrogenase [Actibacterium sp. 188UL27-1]MBM7067266.1 shikimate dehydrogenase [Actibacterium sp. 188UL27-1]